MAIPESIVETPVKRRVGRPSKADIRARGEQALKAITEAKARDRAVTEARARASSASAPETGGSATDNPFTTDDEGMKGSTITKRATEDKEAPQKGVGKKKRKTHRERIMALMDSLTGEIVKPPGTPTPIMANTAMAITETQTPKLTAPETQITEHQVKRQDQVQHQDQHLDGHLVQHQDQRLRLRLRQNLQV
jgi:hypothetical protein